MNRGPLIRALLYAALVAALTVYWALGTSAGRRWRLERTSTSDLMAQSMSHPDDAGQRSTVARRLMAEGQPETAAGVYAGAPGRPAWALAEEARAFLQADMPVDALSPAEDAVRLAPNSADAHVALGQVRYVLGARDQAEAELRQALKLEPYNVAATSCLVCLLADEHNFQAAEDAARELDDDTHSAEALAARGYLADQQGKPEDAIGYLSQAVDREPASGRDWLLLAGVRVRTARTLEEMRAAEQAVTRADHLKPRSPLVPYFRGLVLARQHKPAEAAAAFQEAVRRNPNGTDALYQLSLALESAGRSKESEDARKRFDAAREYRRTVDALQIRLASDPHDMALWKRLRDLARQHDDIPLSTLASRHLGESSP